MYAFLKKNFSIHNDMNVKQIDLHVFSVMFSCLPGKGLLWAYVRGIYIYTYMAYLPISAERLESCVVFHSSLFKSDILPSPLRVRVCFASINIPAKSCRSVAYVCRVSKHRPHKTCYEGAQKHIRRGVLIFLLFSASYTRIWWFRN
jgi:hypothetical protein